MWPFRRRTAAAPAAPVHRAGPADWRHLPPIPTVQTASLGTLDRHFEDHLATRRSPLFLEPLGHHLLPDGPSGRVAAAVVPGPARQFASGRAVQRQTVTYAEPVVAPDDEATAPPARVDAVEAPAEVPAAPIEAPIEAPTEAPTMPTVGELVASATARPTASAPVAVSRPSLVRAPDPMLAPITLPSVERASPPADLDEVAPHVAAAGTVEEIAAAPVGATAVAPAPPAAAATPRSPVTERGLVGGTPAVQPAPADRSIAPADAAPTTGPSPSPAASPSPSGARPPITSAGPPVQRAVASPAPASRAADSMPAGEPATSAPTTTEPLASETPPHVEPPPATEVIGTSREAVDEPATAPTLERMRTVLGPPIDAVPRDAPTATPTAAPLQRDSFGVPAPAPRAAASPAAHGVTPTAHRVDVGPSADPVAAGDAHHVAAGAPAPYELRTLSRLPDHHDSSRPSLSSSAAGSPVVAMQRRSAGPAATPATRHPEPHVARPTLAGEWLPTSVAEVVPATARPTARPLVEHAGPIAAPEPPSSPGPASSLAPVQRRTIIGPPLTGLPPTVRSATSELHPFQPEPSPPVPDTLDADEPRITEWPPVQREAAGQAPTTTATDEAPVMTAAATTGPAAPETAPPAGRSDAEVEELLRTLYPPLRRRLCRDLLLDRERAGYGTDIRY